MDFQDAFIKGCVKHFWYICQDPHLCVQKLLYLSLSSVNVLLFWISSFLFQARFRYAYIYMCDHENFLSLKNGRHLFYGAYYTSYKSNSR